MAMKTSVVKRTRSDPRDKRRQILSEAVSVIGEHGYNGFSIRQLARRCNLTNAGLLHYFGSKDQLLVELLEERDSRNAAAIVESLGLYGDFDPAQQVDLAVIRRSLAAIVEKSVEQPELSRLFAVLAAEALVVGHPASAFFKSREARVIRIYSQVLDPYVDDADGVVRQLFAGLYGLEIIWLRSEQSIDLMTEWLSLVDCLLPVPG